MAQNITEPAGAREDREKITAITNLQKTHEKEEGEVCHCIPCSFSRALKGGLEQRLEEQQC